MIWRHALEFRRYGRVKWRMGKRKWSNGEWEVEVDREITHGRVRVE
jgi:hypothetical protein